MIALWWIKRDFRLDDNSALGAALAQCAFVIPVYFLEPRVYRAYDASAFHLHAQLCALIELQHNLRLRGAELLVIHQDLPEGLEWLRKQFAFTHIFSHEETGADVTFQRDKKVAGWCIENNVVWQELPQSSVVRRLSSRDKRQHFIAQRLLESQPLAAPSYIPQPDMQHFSRHFYIPLLSQLVPDLIDSQIQWGSVQQVNERRAQRALDSFLHERGLGYRGGISSPNKAFFYGSRLSPHIAWGTVSLRRIFSRLQQRLQELDEQLDITPDDQLLQRWQKSLESFSSRLFWRDHFVQRLESASQMEFRALNPAYDSINYTDDKSRLQAWVNGATGFPLIDACMRCLQATGFLNFRMRAMLVNFACFGLHIHWRDLQYPLAKLFVDYEPGIHFSQVQMQAAIVGINSLRVYNPLKQLMDQDPECQFVHRWLPELRRFSARQIALHTDMPLPRYTPAVVNAEHNVRQMKAEIAAIRASDGGREQSRLVLEKHGSRLRNKKSKRVAHKSVTDASAQYTLFTDEHE
ncbi:FAD-binding domain-containing protein [Cellvibrio sp. pealriver]|uniref:FAD-binding domain-containing protein n=1 Tax=Cellvibrio sp. pealriver TaxID=1622269 RepID=UPI00066FC3B3|nr:FAD-binding domain-containing protein [Cellvibrio sp. pealriver]